MPPFNGQAITAQITSMFPLGSSPFCLVSLEEPAQALQGDGVAQEAGCEGAEMRKLVGEVLGPQT